MWKANIVLQADHKFTSQLHYLFSICYQSHLQFEQNGGRVSKLLKVIEPRRKILIHKYQFEVVSW